MHPFASMTYGRSRPLQLFRRKENVDTTAKSDGEKKIGSAELGSMGPTKVIMDMKEIYGIAK